VSYLGIFAIWVCGVFTGWIVHSYFTERAEYRREEQRDAEADARRRDGAP
jgi:hypothetical protein